MKEKIVVSDWVSLTEFREEDKPNLVRYLNDPLVFQNTLTIPNPYTELDAGEWLEKTRVNLEKYGQLTNWAIRHREAGLIGGIGTFVHTGIEGHRDEIGYWLAEPFRGQGIMTAVVAEMTAYMFQTRPLVRIEAWVFAHNPASARLLEKTGFQREGFARKFAKKGEQYMDAILLAKIKD